MIQSNIAPLTFNKSKVVYPETEFKKAFCVKSILIPDDYICQYWGTLPLTIHMEYEPDILKEHYAQLNVTTLALQHRLVNEALDGNLSWNAIDTKKATWLTTYKLDKDESPIGKGFFAICPFEKRAIFVDGVNFNWEYDNQIKVFLSGIEPNLKVTGGHSNI